MPILENGSLRLASLLNVAPSCSALVFVAQQLTETMPACLTPEIMPDFQ